MRRATKLFIAGELACAAAAFLFARADLLDATARGHARNVWDVSVLGSTLGIDVYPHAPGEAGFVEAWYRTPTSEDPELLWRIYGATALPRTFDPAEPVTHPWSCLTQICPPLHPVPEPTPDPEPWMPWVEPPVDA